MIAIQDIQNKRDEEDKLYSRPNTNKERYDPYKQYHRDKPTRAALHELHNDIQRKHEIKRQL